MLVLYLGPSGEMFKKRIRGWPRLSVSRYGSRIRYQSTHVSPLLSYWGVHELSQSHLTSWKSPTAIIVHILLSQTNTSECFRALREQKWTSAPMSVTATHFSGVHLFIWMTSPEQHVSPSHPFWVSCSSVTICKRRTVVSTPAPASSSMAFGFGLTHCFSDAVSAQLLCMSQE